jgi:hypothetical protein
MANNMREIELNARRARYITDHLWDATAGKPNKDAILEIGLIRAKIERLMETRPELRAKLAVLYEDVTTEKFWDNLADSMEGTHFAVCGLDFPNFVYPSALRPLWDLGENDSLSSALARSRPKRKWGFHPIGCFGKLIKLFFKLLLPAWLVLFAIHLWSPPAGDAPKPEPAKPKPAASVAAAKSAAGRPTAGQTQQGAQVGGKRFVVKQPLPIYRLDEEKHPVVAARIPAGSVVRVTGNLNAKVARVEVELPNGRKGKGLARLVDLQHLAKSAK